MPIYEYECKKCGKVSQFIERLDEWRFWRRRCKSCGSLRLKRVFSTFSTSISRSTADMLNEISRMGDINFVPRGPGMDVPSGPPPGGCPYGITPEKAAEESKES